jgi:hypothetical protein
MLTDAALAVSEPAPHRHPHPALALEAHAIGLPSFG